MRLGAHWQSDAVDLTAKRCGKSFNGDGDGCELYHRGFCLSEEWCPHVVKASLQNKWKYLPPVDGSVEAFFGVEAD